MKKKRKKKNVAARLVIRDGAKMTPTGVASIVAWLRRQAEWFEEYHEVLSPKFTASYHYK